MSVYRTIGPLVNYSSHGDVINCVLRVENFPSLDVLPVDHIECVYIFWYMQYIKFSCYIIMHNLYQQLHQIYENFNDRSRCIANLNKFQISKFQILYSDCRIHFSASTKHLINDNYIIQYYYYIYPKVFWSWILDDRNG